MSRFEISKVVYRKADREIPTLHSEEQYRVYKIYDKKIQKWISIDDFAEIAKEKEKK